MAAPASSSASRSTAALLAEVRAAHPDRALVHLANGDALVWTVEDVKLLRTSHHIIGLMSGTLPIAPQQNVFLGLPLQLIPEEVTFLLRRGAIVLVDQSALERQALYEEAEASGESGGSSPALEKSTLPQQVSEGDAATSPTESGVLVPRPPPSTSFQTNSRHIHTTLSSARHPPSTSTGPPTATSTATPTWPYPSTPLERARCATFDDLHARGYYMGTGLRFGGEFVVYPGDPLRYHSHFSTTVLVASSGEDEGGESSMSGLDFVASGRLGTAVKKAHLICAVDVDDVDMRPEDEDEDEDGHSPIKGPTETSEAAEAQAKFEDGGSLEGRTAWGRVRYYSLTWSGFGT
ncbi:tRNA-splicing endonuclease subunit [Tilletia horrida]|uniref:tRNA-splicing endonuclease subunit Sen34 n=1 Tax=Tilletia horrida TaxID=155126 RepID=A0AAN6GE90_9BASI|nr:tRNA-splicing endonuclease subunit [Tilletia horrida]